MQWEPPPARTGNRKAGPAFGGHVAASGTRRVVVSGTASVRCLAAAGGEYEEEE